MARILVRAVGEVEAAFDWARHRLRRRGRGPFRIVAYRGHGTQDSWYLRGRVLEGEAIPPATGQESRWRNLLNSLRRLETDEVPAARVRGRVGGREWEVLTDGEGYFDLRMQVAGLEVGRSGWQPVELELLDPASPSPVRTVAQVLVPPAGSTFGVISDIDDTVVKTDATHILRMLRLVLLTNAHTRLAFEGVAAFYRALQGDRSHPVFYVSSSPWSLFELLEEVFHVHGIPAGPLFLKDYGISREMFISAGHRDHKLEAIEHIFQTHPDLPFVLLGDSGQKDPEIYREVAQRHPSRVAAVYIRNVTPGARDAVVQQIAEQMRADGIPTAVVEDTVGAALHAVAHGLIEERWLPVIRGEEARDEAAPGPLESLIR